MIAQTLDLFDGLFMNILLKGDVARNHIAAKSEFLPHHNAEFIADVVEIVRFVVAATPFANHVHVRIASVLKDFAMDLRCDAVGKTIEGNNVRTFGINFDAVYDELETLSPLIGDAPQFDGPQSGFRFRAGPDVLAGANHGRKAVSVLRAISAGIPQLRRCNANGKRNMIHARIKLQSLSSIRSLRAR